MSGRQFIDDLRRAAFLVTLVGGVAVAVWAGTYWGWWAYVWDVALPARIVGILAISSTAFVVWYGTLFSGHYYFGVPSDNPLWQHSDMYGSR